MRWTWKVFYAFPLAWAGAAYFGLPLPATWEATADFLISADLWIVNHAAYPGLFEVGIGLILGVIVIPEAVQIAKFVLHGGAQRDAYQRFQSQFHALADDRERFWSLIERAYSVWEPREGAKTGASKVFDVALTLARFPHFLPPKKGAAVGAVVREHTRDIEDDGSRAFWDFITDLDIEIERGKDEPDLKKEFALLQKTEREEFFTTRRSLAKFWDGAAEGVFSGEIERRKIDGVLAADKSLIKVLCYIEGARALTGYGRGGPGKRWLFRIGNELHRRRRKRRLLRGLSRAYRRIGGR